MRNCSPCFCGGDVTRSARSCDDDNFTVYDKSPNYLRGKNRTTFYCCGPPKQLGSFRKRHGMSTGRRESIDDVGIAEEADELTNYDNGNVVKPEVPYISQLPIDLYLGRSIEVHGKTFTNCKRFTINLSTGKENDSDLALHFNPRLDRRIVVRNHRIYAKWGTEEVVSTQPFPFKPGKNFSVLILIADEQFMVAINKVHYCAFSFRIPTINITHIVITGDISLNLINYGRQNSYPPLIFRKTPYIIIPSTTNKIDNKCDIRRRVHVIKDGTRIDISGRLKLLPRGFYINLQEGLSLWPHPLIAFHMNLRLQQAGTQKEVHEIIFNSWLNGCWGEESIVKQCPFLPGHQFRIVIECCPTCYLVEVNEKFFYKHDRVEKLNVDCLIIYGDVVINKVVLRRSRRSNSNFKDEKSSC